MEYKKYMLSVLVLVIVAMFAANALALNINITDVELDEDTLSATGTNVVRDLERGNEFDVKVHVVANEAASDVEIEATITGVHNDDVSDSTDTFDMRANTAYVKKLTLTLPQRMDQDNYKLRVRVEDRNGNTVQETYDLVIDTQRNNVMIKDVILSPASSVQSGRALLATVRVKNYGENDEEDVKVTVSIPELGITASDYIEELKGDTDEESSSTEELYLRIPACATPKDYTMNVEVEYDDGDAKATAKKTVTVVEGDYCPSGAVPVEETGMSVITVGTTSQNVVSGEGGAIYPITISNQGTTTGTYSVSVDLVGNWATVQLSPSNVVTIPSGATSTVYVYIAANSAAAGENMFSVTVSKSGEVLQQVPMKATVVAPSKAASVTGWSGLKKALEIALVVLVVLLVIFGLIVGFNKLRNSGDGNGEDSEKTYY